LTELFKPTTDNTYNILINIKQENKMPGALEMLTEPNEFARKAQDAIFKKIYGFDFTKEELKKII